MIVKYQQGYYPEKQIEVIEIVSKHKDGINFHVLRCADGVELQATHFEYASGCVMRASLPENW